MEGVSLDALFDNDLIEQLGGIPSLLSTPSAILSEWTGVPVEQVRAARRQLVTAARRLVCATNAADLLASQMRRMSLGCATIDRHLDGGLSPSTLTELTGAAGCGKTQLCLQMALACCLRRPWAHVLYVCTEGALPVGRLRQMLAARDGSSAAVSSPPPLDRILVHQASDVVALTAAFQHHVPALVERLGRRECDDPQQQGEDEPKDEWRLCLLVVDSITAVFRGAFELTESLQRARHLQTLGACLRHVSARYRICVVCVNQVSAVTDTDTDTERCKPALGLCWAHQVHTRLSVCRLDTASIADSRDSSGHVNRLSVDFSSYLPRASVDFRIKSEGVVGMEVSEENDIGKRH